MRGIRSRVCQNWGGGKYRITVITCAPAVFHNPSTCERVRLMCLTLYYCERVRLVCLTLYYCERVRLVCLTLYYCERVRLVCLTLWS